MEKKEQTTGKKKLGLQIAVTGIVLLVLVWILLQHSFKSGASSEQLLQIASEFNKSYPVMVDDYTRLDDATVLKDSVLQFNFTLINTAKEDVDMVAIQEDLPPAIISDVIKNPLMKILRDHQVTIIYHYKDKNGKFVYKFPVTPDLYETK